MDKTTKKVSIEVSMPKLRRDGSWLTFNSAMELMRRGNPTPEQNEQLLKLAQCTACDRIMCDHTRRGKNTDLLPELRASFGGAGV